MNVQIYDRWHEQRFANWTKGEFNGLIYLHERIGGMISASFNVPCVYYEPYEWAKRRNQVEIYSKGGTCVFDGFISNLSRYWDEKETGIRVSCYGWVAKLTRDYVTAMLSGEKGSTYITDHIITGMFAGYVSAGEIDTGDYLIPGAIEVAPQRTKRWMLDQIYDYNRDTHEWGVWGREFYFRPIADTVSYRTTIYGGCTGQLSQGIDDQAKILRLAYRDTNGAWQILEAEDTDSDDPDEYILETLDGNMTSAQATQAANARLEELKRAGSNASIRVKRLWGRAGSGQTGELDVAEMEPGRILAVNGIVPGEASVYEADIDNDLDTFVIASVKYDAEAGVADVGPGKLPHTLPTVVGGKR